MEIEKKLEEAYEATMPMNTAVSRQGYSIYKSCIDDNVLSDIKSELTVSPFIPKDYADIQKPTPFKLYQEGPNKVYVPKHYGIAKFGVPQVSRIDDGEDINITFNGSLRTEQQEPVKIFLDSLKNPEKHGGILNLTCASGKCLGRDTPILMFDGTIKKVQDVTVGDMLMGDDSMPRTVLSTCKGYDKLYMVKQKNGIDYVVNSAHILSLKIPHLNKIVDIPVTEYIKSGYKHYGYKQDIHFAKRPTSIDPYKAGYSAALSGFQQGIPQEYKINDRNIQAAYLLGVLDARGQFNGHEYVVNIRDKKGADELIFMLISMGIAGKYTRNKLYIFGKNLTLLKPNQSMVSIRSCKRYFNTNIEIIEHEEHGEYFGFEIDGNRRFLLSDCTVTHNTVMAIYLICQIQKKTLVVVHKDFLMQQWKERINQFCPSAKIGIIKAKQIDTQDKDIVIASLQSLSMKEYDKEVLNGFGFVVIDEVHHTSAEVFSRALRKVSFKYTLGLSATIKRKDGLSKVFMWYLGSVLFSNVKNTKTDNVDIDCLYYYDPAPSYSKEVYMMGSKLNISKMLNNICEHEPRVIMIADKIKNIIDKEPCRKIIVLSDRRMHLSNIGERLLRLGISSGNYFGGMKQQDLKASEEKQVILGTFCMVSEGFDCKSLDTLVLASPKSDVVQSVGRILREEQKNRRNTPLVVDIIDQFSVFEKQALKRQQYYKKQRYNIMGLATEAINNKQVKLTGNCIMNLE